MYKEPPWDLIQGIGMNIILPKKVQNIIETIENAGYEAFAVGGCIRDSILEREPNDWDITTSAKPEIIKSLFLRTIDTGLEHGTVTVMMEKEGFEVTTYRIDGEYEDHRHPSEVIFTENLKEDLKRRDFTINAMAYNERCGLVDVFGGMEDIEKKRIRAVGCAKDRFMEDALRILRAIRFSAQLGYEIEEETRGAICELAPTLEKISKERIQVELVKLLTSSHPDTMRVAYETGVTKVILPEFDKCMETEQNHPHHKYNVGEHILHTLIFVPNEKHLRIAMFLHDIGKSETIQIDEKGITHFHTHAKVGARIAVSILKRLKFDNTTIRKVEKLVEYHDYGNGVVPNEKIVRRAMFIIGEEYFPDLFYIREADIYGQSDYKREEKLYILKQWKDCYQTVLNKKQCVSMKGLAITGKELIDLGVAPGKQMGEMLQYLLEYVLDNPEKNDKESLIQLLKENGYIN